MGMRNSKVKTWRVGDPKLLVSVAKDDFKAGDLVLVEETVGVVLEDAKKGEKFSLVYEASEIVVPKSVQATFKPGSYVYFSPSSRPSSVRAHGNSASCCGIALEEAGEGTTEILIDLRPF